jgi:hypothetical protein
VYSNPNTLLESLPFQLLRLPFQLLRKVKSVLKKLEKKKKQEEDLSFYFHPHSIEWWSRFGDIASVKILPWRSFSSYTQKRLIPNNKIGTKMFDVLFNLEERFPTFFVNHFQYPMIILTKRES